MMTTGMMMGFAIGLTVSAVFWWWIAVAGATRRNRSNERIEELLERKTIAMERIAGCLERKEDLGL